MVVGIFKNEAMGIAEWISHYRWQGAKHIYLIDNNSTDDWRSRLGPEDWATLTVKRREEVGHRDP